MNIVGYKGIQSGGQNFCHQFKIQIYEGYRAIVQAIALILARLGNYVDESIVLKFRNWDSLANGIKIGTEVRGKKVLIFFIIMA